MFYLVGFGQVLEVCKPLEALGVCTLFLHSGVSIDVQIERLAALTISSIYHVFVFHFLVAK